MRDSEHRRADVALLLVAALVAFAGFMGWLS